MEHGKAALSSEVASRERVEAELRSTVARANGLASELSASQSSCIELQAKVTAATTSLDHTSRELATTQDRLSALNTELPAVLQSRADLQSQVQELLSRCSGLDGELAEARAQVTALSTEAVGLKFRLQEKESDLGMVKHQHSSELVESIDTCTWQAFQATHWGRVCAVLSCVWGGGIIVAPGDM